MAWRRPDSMNMDCPSRGGDRVDLVGDAAVRDGPLEGLAGDALLEADVEFGAGEGVRDEPHFGFRLAAEFSGDVRGGMNLDGEVVRGIEDLDEEREAFGIRQVLAEDFPAVTQPEVVQGFSFVRALGDDGLFVFAVNDFPCLAEGLTAFREGAAVNGFQFPPAPDAFHVEGLKGDGFHAHEVSNDSGSVEGGCCGNPVAAYSPV